MIQGHSRIRGFDIYAGFLDQTAQGEIAQAVRDVLGQAPLFQPVTPRGKPMSVRMSSAGRFGWVSDRKGYRYSETHPDGMPWPGIPDPIVKVWTELSGTDRQPECCLINWYGPEARMGLHQDRDEADMTQPVLSISLGDDGLFRIGNKERGGKTESIWLSSGDVVVMPGPARWTYHGIDRIRPGNSTVLQNPGRLNLTLRVVT